MNRGGGGIHFANGDDYEHKDDSDYVSPTSVGGFHRDYNVSRSKENRRNPTQSVAIDIDDFVDEPQQGDTTDQQPFEPYGQPAAKYRSSDNRSNGVRTSARQQRTSPVDLDETIAELPTPQTNNRSATGAAAARSGRTGTSNLRYSSNATLSSRRVLQQRAKEKESKVKKNGQSKKYNPSLPEPKKEDTDSCTARCWPGYTLFCTFLIPNCLICKKGKAAKQAWREKVTIFMIMMSLNVIFLGVFGVIPLYFCAEVTPLHDYEWFNTVIEPTCLVLNYIMYGILFFAAGILLLQCFCSLIVAAQMLHMKLAYSTKKDDGKTRPGEESAVCVLVPCYNEGEGELRKTIKSILDTDYPQENKILVVVADGIITGKGEWMNTPLHLSKILGFKVSRKDPGYSYKSIGAAGENRASVYSGVYTVGEKSLKYIVVVKRGTPEEKESSRPGNRGKRDSQLIMMGLFNRVHYDRRLCDLDRAICSALNDLAVPPTEIEYMLAIDADTRVSKLSMSYMVGYMQRNEGVLACCGETKVDNKTQSWVTMIQVFEYFASHALKKSFESIFGCVTCLPGCFTMYRMFCPDDMRPLLSADNVFQAYSRNDIESLHDKNLFHLGEDRMLTTLLLKYFSEFRLNFVPAASCWTIVPNEFKILLSQRRRWINSTFHNMWELLKVNTMCGICCISMKTVVILDMLSTMILPAAMLYALSFIYTVFIVGEPITQMTLILYGVILGAQVLIFLVRSRVDHLFWFLIYLVLGLPVFFFILPLYSFWNMDDLSWGTTRQVASKKPAAAAK